jgi:hypothetical protein
MKQNLLFKYFFVGVPHLATFIFLFIIILNQNWVPKIYSGMGLTQTIAEGRKIVTKYKYRYFSKTLFKYFFNYFQKKKNLITITITSPKKYLSTVTSTWIEK